MEWNYNLNYNLNIKFITKEWEYIHCQVSFFWRLARVNVYADPNICPLSGFLVIQFVSKCQCINRISKQINKSISCEKSNIHRDW